LIRHNLPLLDSPHGSKEVSRVDDDERHILHCVLADEALFAGEQQATLGGRS
jgi:hypothetical protein